jgi:hypothetical protein
VTLALACARRSEAALFSVRVRSTIPCPFTQFDKECGRAGRVHEMPWAVAV